MEGKSGTAGEETKRLMRVGSHNLGYLKKTATNLHGKKRGRRSCALWPIKKWGSATYSQRGDREMWFGSMSEDYFVQLRKKA